jgi:hypothetical protein
MLKRFLVIAACAMVLSAPVKALSVVPLELDQIIDRSTYAFEGTVLSMRSEIEAGSRLIVTYTTFSVTDNLKGTLPATYTVKQVGGANIEGGLRMPGVSYGVGQSYVVFLAGVSDAGFTSPIGLMQGKFSVQDDGTRKRVTNGQVLRVPKKLDSAVAEGGELDARLNFELDEFKSRVKARVERVTREERLK